MNQKPRQGVPFSWAIILVLVTLGITWGAADRVPDTKCGMVFVSTPTNATQQGETDSLHCTVDKNLKVSVANVASFAAVPVASISSFAATDAGNNGTPNTLVAATPGQAVILYSITLTNRDSLAHYVHVATGGGQTIWPVYMPAGTDAIYDGQAAGFAKRTAVGDSLTLFIDDAFVNTAVQAQGEYVKQ